MFLNTLDSQRKVSLKVSFVLQKKLHKGELHACLKTNTRLNVLVNKL